MRTVFDLQLFAGATAEKATQLSVESMDHMAIVINKSGEKWAPRNPEAQFLSVKGGAVDDDAKKASFLGDLWDKVTTALTGKAATAEKGSTADDVLEDALGYASYDVLWTLTNQLQWDLYAIFQAGEVFDVESKRAAIQGVFDRFVAEIAKIAPLFLGEVDLASLATKCAEKAGAKFSKETKAHLAGIGEAAKTMGDAHKQMTEHLDALGSDGSSDSGGTGTSTDANKGEATHTGAADAPPEVAASSDPAAPSDVAVAVKAAIEEQMTAAKASFDATIAEVRKAADQSVAAANEATKTAREEAKAARETVASLQTLVTEMTSKARQSTATGGVSTVTDEGQRVGAAGETGAVVQANKAEIKPGMSLEDGVRTIFSKARAT